MNNIDEKPNTIIDNKNQNDVSKHETNNEATICETQCGANCFWSRYKQGNYLND